MENTTTIEATDREAGTGTVNVDECVLTLRAIVEAAEAKDSSRLRRILLDEFQPESLLVPAVVSVDSELIERAMKALGVPTPKVPRSRKIPTTPTDAQAAVLKALAATDGEATPYLISSRRWGYGSDYYIAGRSRDAIRAQTFDALRAYKWITHNEGGTSRETYFVITQAGRDVLAAYNAKRSRAAIAKAEVQS